MCIDRVVRQRSDSKSGSEAAVITIDATDRASMQEMMRTLDLEDDGTLHETVGVACT